MLQWEGGVVGMPQHVEYCRVLFTVDLTGLTVDQIMVIPLETVQEQALGLRVNMRLMVDGADERRWSRKEIQMYDYLVAIYLALPVISNCRVTDIPV